MGRQKVIKQLSTHLKGTNIFKNDYRRARSSDDQKHWYHILEFRDDVKIFGAEYYGKEDDSFYDQHPYVNILDEDQTIFTIYCRYYGNNQIQWQSQVGDILAYTQEWHLSLIIAYKLPS